MLNLKISPLEILILVIVAAILGIGFIFLAGYPEMWAIYISEDNVAEWLTVIALLCGSAVCFYRFITLFRFKRWVFLFFTMLAGLILFAGAGEEISWGQRLFDIKTPEYFLKNNIQQETNFHNLLVGGVKINIVIFSIGLTIAFAILLLLFPYLYRRNMSVKKWIDAWGIPLPKNYQIIGFLLVFLLTTLMQDPKDDELFECGIAFMLFLVILAPYNAHTFKKELKT